MNPIIRAVAPDDYDAAIDMLQVAGLPTEDLSIDRLALVAEAGDKILGIVGLESFGTVALLRSLVVAHDARGGGIGEQLVTALENQCHDSGVTDIWLLTIDADAFFSRLGYAMRDRTNAPKEIRSTEEFSSLCPGDAALMSKTTAIS